ncbi:hypothetical protein WG66_002319 [Moniliophthora roreri]|nr:hypothetical protein WG66_002319 [Moniliophthora roreri]
MFLIHPHRSVQQNLAKSSAIDQSYYSLMKIRPSEPQNASRPSNGGTDRTFPVSGAVLPKAWARRRKTEDNRGYIHKLCITYIEEVKKGRKKKQDMV